MIDWLALWRPPALDGSAPAEHLRTAHVVLRAGFLLVLATWVVTNIIIDPVPPGAQIVSLASLAIHSVALVLLRRRLLRPTIIGFTALHMVVILYAMWMFGGVRAPGVLVVGPLVVLIGVTISSRAAVIAAIVASVAMFAILVAQRQGRLPVPAALAPERYWLIATGCVVLTALMLHTAGRIVDASHQKAADEQRARRDLEERLIQARRLEAVGRLAAGVAHDFNNVLTIVFAEATRLDAIGGRAATSAVNIREAAERASAMTRQMLSFGRRHHLEPEILELGGVVRQFERLLGRFVGDEIALELGLAEDLEGIRADRTQIEQVVLNLVTNARDAMPSGGTISIRTGRTRIGDRPAVFLQVRDTGTGIDAEVRAHLFEPFFTTKEIGKGTGLGLATVHSIVTQLGGEVRVDSVPGAGSTFTVVLPVVEAAAARPMRKPTAPATATPGARIVIVDDDAQVRGAIEQIVTDGGYVATCARSGAEVLSAASAWTEPPDLLLTDVVMPDMTGPELVRRLREQHPSLRVVFTSGYAEDRIIDRGVPLDTVHFVSKPFERTALLDKIAAVLADE